MATSSSSHPSPTDTDRRVMVLFGLPACGKNHVGLFLARHYGFAFHDGDDDLPEPMRQAILRKEVATPEMRDAHIANIVSRIHSLRKDHDRIAVAAALFKQQHRARIRKAFPDIQMVWVKATASLLHERLASRQNHLADVAYAEKIFTHFESPGNEEEHDVLENDRCDAHIRKQLEDLVAYSLNNGRTM
eukprot:CAMPEP_0170192638 /NCGR_PEP_ID=MMETSP0040_2-20121228/54789_1 /TAXON_ID=641309 /ORGANISM="Lotharella oceanica, Strain CCMP622" /LENGTH=188 /DNA_ID=CAMNT_0010441061 /DNA_START=72 /DNA_END=638 /DNA_ORIENTATION=-